MGETAYRDFTVFGLPLVTAAHTAFPSLVHDIESRPEPFGSWPTGGLSNAAVLLNESGSAVLGISYLWRYTNAAGESHTSHYSNLGSSTQLEVMTGRSRAVQDIGTFILPGSKRLITERGMFGNTLDVPGREARLHGGGGYIGAGGSGVKPSSQAEIVLVELVLDLAILEDGRCVGPDEGGLFDNLIEDLSLIHSTAQQAATALHNGTSSGQVFEMLRPLARHTAERATQSRWGLPFLRMFANIGIHQLVNLDTTPVASWLETEAQTPRLRLYQVS